MNHNDYVLLIQLKWLKLKYGIKNWLFKRRIRKISGYKVGWMREDF